MSATLDKIIEEAKELTQWELRQLRDTVDSLLLTTPEGGPQMTEDEFEQHLRRKGILGEASPSGTAAHPDPDFKPIRVAGKPVSEMIIEERR